MYNLLAEIENYICTLPILRCTKYCMLGFFPESPHENRTTGIVRTHDLCNFVLISTLITHERNVYTYPSTPP